MQSDSSVPATGSSKRAGIDAAALRIASIGGFFATKSALGAAIVLVSARVLTVAEFASYSQLFLLTGYLALLGSAGLVNGIIQRTAAIRGDQADERALIEAALRIWLVVAMAMCIATTVFADPISRFLVNDARFSSTLPYLGAVVALSGLGQIFTALLTGRGRLGLSLALQAIGMVTGGTLSLILLVADQPTASVIAFAAGPLATTALSTWNCRNLFDTKAAQSRKQEHRALMGHASAFATVAAVPPLVLFAIRSVYQDRFGLEMLGYWLAANRISDISTQMFGLYLSQIFMPHMSSLRSQTEVRRYAIATASAGASLFLAPLGIFLLAPPMLVGIFLGSSFGPAVIFIIGYMVGDIFRAVTSVTMMSALSSGQPRRYAVVELAASAIFASTAVLLIHSGVTGAPWQAYIASHVAITLAAGAYLLNRNSLR